jgi:hypothetical protein
MKNTTHLTVKKTWFKPEVIIIAACNVEGGALPGYNEGEFISSSVTGFGGAHLGFKNQGSAGYLLFNPINAYNS